MTANLACAYTTRDDHSYRANELTRGPWNPLHQHAGPPSALVCRAIERAAAVHGLTHLGRLTGNLLRPVPIGDCRVELEADYVGRNAAHYSARLYSEDKEVARFTALMQRETDLPLPEGNAGDPGPGTPKPPGACEEVQMPFGVRERGYADLVENRIAHGQFFQGPCAVWFRLRHPLVNLEEPSAYQRVAVAADSGNGISAVLDFGRYSFVNCDLTINLFRRPVGDWICLDARTLLGESGCGLAESALFDERGLIGRATQTLSVRPR